METFLGQVAIGVLFGLGALGSALGIGAAGRAAAGAWAKEAKAGQQLRFTYIVLLGMPLTQTIYAFMLLYTGLRTPTFQAETVSAYAGLMLSVGLAGGLAEMFSAWMQGLIGASAVRALSEGEGKGFVFMIIAMGIAETVGVFGFVFLLLVLLQIPA